MNPARRAAWRALVALEKGKARRLDPVLDRRGLRARDRALALELARGVERCRLFLDFVLSTLVERELPRDPQVLVALRLGAYQLLKLTRVPPYAAVDDTLRLLARDRGFVNAVLRRLSGMVVPRPVNTEAARREVALGATRTLVLPADCLPDPRTERAAYCARVHGLPEFLVERWASCFGDDIAAQLATAADRAPAVILRAHSCKGDARALQARLAEEGTWTELLEHPLLLRWTGGASPFGGAAYCEGWFLAQDATAGLAVEAVAAQPGDTVLDLCAGPGTKASVLAEAVGATGTVHAYDRSEARRAPIRDNRDRLGHQSVLLVHDDLEAVPVVDRALADVPCSNTGVLARRVEVRRWLRPDMFAELAARQKVLLREALRRVRPGGIAVYSTCSLEPEENEEVVEAVLGPAHRVLRRQRTFPDAHGSDGGFVAVIEVVEATRPAAEPRGLL